MYSEFKCHTNAKITLYPADLIVEIYLKTNVRKFEILIGN